MHSQTEEKNAAITILPEHRQIVATRGAIFQSQLAPIDGYESECRRSLASKQNGCPVGSACIVGRPSGFSVSFS